MRGKKSERKELWQELGENATCSYTPSADVPPVSPPLECFCKEGREPCHITTEANLEGTVTFTLITITSPLSGPSATWTFKPPPPFLLSSLLSFLCYPVWRREQFAGQLRPRPCHFMCAGRCSPGLFLKEPLERNVAHILNKRFTTQGFLNTYRPRNTSICSQ